MNLVELAVKLSQLLNGSVIFLKLDSEVIDYAHNNLKIHLWSSTGILTVELTPDNFYEVLSLLNSAIFENKVSLVVWNAKSLCSYIFFRTGVHLLFEKQLFDLKVAESFIGIRNRPPANFDEVKTRVKIVTSDSSWSKYKNLHTTIYIPLITKVLPSIEAEGVFDIATREKLHCFYEVEGTVNGRLSCSIPNKGYFNPHSMTDAQKVALIPFGQDCSFIYFDLHYMEVCVLAWLSKDAKLLSLLQEKEDFYRSLFKLLAGSECDTEAKRAVAKSILLPVVYGEGSKSLGQKLNLEAGRADKLIQRLKSLFPTLFAWIDEYPIQDGTCTDYFGRKRRFTDSERYLYRNFIIQSPAAIVCLEKLVQLYRALGTYGKLVAHIHDGYLIKSADKSIETVRAIASYCLESESLICPGLKFSTNFKIGKNLS